MDLGLATAILLYNLVLWDWLPSAMLHSRYCSRDAGFWVYKTPDQWKRENADVLGALKYKDRSDTTRLPNGTAYHINERMDWVTERTRLWPAIDRHENKVIDVATREVLAREVFFQCGVCGRPPRSALDYRFWMDRCECALEERRLHGGFFKVESEFKKVGVRYSVDQPANP